MALKYKTPQKLILKSLNNSSEKSVISVLGPSRTISSAHAGEATPMSPNFAPSVLIVRLLRIVLLYLLYKRVNQ
jgi:predicted neutral ceramidase superfamily lipid hydrolase